MKLDTIKSIMHGIIDGASEKQAEIICMFIRHFNKEEEKYDEQTNS